MSAALPMPSDAPDAADDELADVAVERRVLSSTAQFEGHVWSVRTDVVDLGDGQRVTRDVIVHPGAVGIIAVDDELRVLMVRQYRHPVGMLLWEPPAGLLDIEGEEPIDAAARELLEETGIRADRWTVLVDLFTSPGGSDEAVRVYLARGLSAIDAADRTIGDGEERDMPIRWVPLLAARDAVLAGSLHNPLAATGVLAAAALLLDGSLGAGGAARPADAPWLRSQGSRQR